MTSVTLMALSPTTGVAEWFPLPLEPGGAPCLVRLRSFSGAAGLHLAFAIDGEIFRRAEAQVQGAQLLELEIALDATLEFHFSGRDWQVLSLPPDPGYGPAQPFRPASLDGGLDIAIVVDGTLRVFDGLSGADAFMPSSRLLLADKEKDQLFEQLLGFVEAFGAESLQASTLAFGDEPLSGAAAVDLQPAYHLFPTRSEDLALRSLRPSDLIDLLARLGPTGGGDLVDALADALAVCAKLRWRPQARKIVLVVGDSPAYSLLEPAPWGCDARARQHDVDVESMKLHERGIQIVTLFCPPPREVYAYFEPRLQAIFDYTRLQYRRIASAPEFSFELPTFDPHAAAARVAACDSLIFRGPGLGELLQAEPTANVAPSVPIRYLPPPSVMTRRSAPELATYPRPSAAEITPSPSDFVLPLQHARAELLATELPAPSTADPEKTIPPIEVAPAATEDSSTGEIQWT